MPRSSSHEANVVVTLSGEHVPAEAVPRRGGELGDQPDRPARRLHLHSRLVRGVRALQHAARCQPAAPTHQREHAPGRGRGGSKWAIQFSPDGQTVVYLADQAVNDRTELFAVGIDGAQAPLVLNGPLPAGGNVGTAYDATLPPFLITRTDRSSCTSPIRTAPDTPSSTPARCPELGRRSRTSRPHALRLEVRDSRTGFRCGATKPRAAATISSSPTSTAAVAG